MGDCIHRFGHMLNIGDGTGYYMCSMCEMEITEDHHAAINRIKELEAAITKTLNNNGHLADGDVCTLIDLKRAMPNWELNDVSE